MTILTLNIRNRRYWCDRNYRRWTKRTRTDYIYAMRHNSGHLMRITMKMVTA
jgi:hypothetical protein